MAHPPATVLVVELILVAGTAHVLSASVAPPEGCSAGQVVPNQLSPWDCRRATIVKNAVTRSIATQDGSFRRVGTSEGSHVALDDGEVPLGSHLRTDNASLAAAIQTGLERSRTFKRLVHTIDRTDGIVYVARGTCGFHVRACLVLQVTPSGPNRLLRVLVDARKVNKELVASIGHELQHAVEVLHEVRIRNNHDIYNFYQREGPTDKGRFETEAAIQAGLDVLAEMEKSGKSR
jgi:hypothetical protein